MNNKSNIYDIDGDLIRAIDDTHKFTIEEVQEKIEKYKKKAEELDEKDPKLQTYTTYIRNLQSYLFTLYSTMKPEELNAEIERQKAQKDVNEQIEQAINELKKEIENETEDTSKADSERPNSEEAGNAEESGDEHRAKTQADFLVDGTGRPETIMDEYVDYEEV